MRVSLIDFTGAGSANPARHAARILLFTKSTRLDMTPKMLEEIINLPDQEILNRLKDMSNTNPGSWEFVNFTFLIEKVTRAFTHQLVRTRTASYAQQTMRVLQMDEWTYGKGPSIVGTKDSAYDNIMREIDHTYKYLLRDGATVEDARGILPTNIHTNICVAMNMRNFINLARKRASLRVQEEYRHVIQAMIVEIEKVYPWFYLFYKNDEMKAYQDLQYIIEESKGLTQDEKTAIYKKLDIIKSGLD